MCTSEKVHKGQQKLIAAKRLQNDLVIPVVLYPFQCVQIWRNFAAIAKFQTFWAEALV